MSVSPDPQLPTWAKKPADHSFPPTSDSGGGMEVVRHQDDLSHLQSDYDRSFSQNIGMQNDSVKRERKSLKVLLPKQHVFHRMYNIK